MTPHAPVAAVPIERRGAERRRGGGAPGQPVRFGHPDPPMRQTATFFLLALGTLFALVDPLAAIPVLLKTTSSYSDAQRARTVRRAVVTATVALVVFSLVGGFLLRLFGVSVLALRAATGLIFLVMGLDELTGHRSRDKATPAEVRDAATHQAHDDPGIVPLGVPTLAGGAAASAALALMGESPDVVRRLSVFAAVLTVMGATWVVLHYGPALLARMGQIGMNVVTRLQGLLLLTLACEALLGVVRALMAERG